MTVETSGLLLNVVRRCFWLPGPVLNIQDSETLSSAGAEGLPPLKGRPTAPVHRLALPRQLTPLAQGRCPDPLPDPSTCPEPLALPATRLPNMFQMVMATLLRLLPPLLVLPWALMPWALIALPATEGQLSLTPCAQGSVLSRVSCGFLPQWPPLIASTALHAQPRALGPASLKDALEGSDES